MNHTNRTNGGEFQDFTAVSFDFKLGIRFTKTLNFRKSVIILLIMMCFLPILLRGQNANELRRVFYPFQKNSAGNPIYENALVGGFNCPQFSEIDLNNDGKLDLFAFDRIGNASVTYLNVNNKYVFSPEYLDNFPKLNDWALLRDFNGDGITDIFTYNDGAIGGIRVFKGKMVNNRIAFDRMNFAFRGNILSYLLNGLSTNIYVNSVDLPAIDDIDGDGDLDILSFEVGGGHVYMYRNYSVERSFRRDSLVFELYDDCWGKFLDNGFTKSVKLGNNNTCASGFQGGVPIVLRHPGAAITTFDADNDGDKDALLGSISFENVSFLINGGTRSTALITAQDNNFPSNTEGVNLPVFPASYLLDLDFDGKKDLIVSPASTNYIENYAVNWFYKNTGTNAVPTFQIQSKDFLVRDMIDLGTGANPTLVDVNADGLLDLVVGNGTLYAPLSERDARLFLFQNIGSASAPVFRLVDDNWLNFKSLSSLDNYNFSPTFGDLDGDGDLDLLVGEESGTLFFVENKAGANRPLSMATPVPVWKNIEAGAACKPQIVDLDKDGLPDIVSGTRTGYIRFFRNIGTRTVPNFASTATISKVGAVDVGEFGFPTGFAAPVFMPLNNKMYLFCGSESGRIRVYDNIEGKLNDTFRLINNDYGLLKSGGHVTLAIGNVTTHENKLELFVGNQRGGLSAYQMSYNTDGTTPTQEPNSQAFASVSPNPVSSVFTLQIEPQVLNTEYELKLFNTVGQCVKSISLDTPQYQMNISDIANGVYFLHLKMKDDRHQVLKIVKN
ncbi:MAG: T9SS type A sorting domain-containing protein [Saprospiraceae bacterium]|nr:T9SS type A sorting domain-containing protein [Saprospiraceae bacterium]